MCIYIYTMRGHRSEAHLPPCRRAHFWDRRVTAKQSPAEHHAGVGMDQPGNATSRDGVRTTDNQFHYVNAVIQSDGLVPGFSWCRDNDKRTPTCNHSLQGIESCSRNTGALETCPPSNETKTNEILTEMGNVPGSRGVDSF